ncbi:Cna B-type domain-containing protein, partial [Helcococcus massiliensis]|uniref:Cna B-type domain-containing protein n=1 Tax=Helcococcus massiliensis TaxID=2040290 RepID=UPI000CDEA98D
MNMSYKKGLSMFLAVILLLSFIGPNKIAKAEASKKEYKLSFDLYRGATSNYENLFAVYSNYYMNHPESGIFDEDEWELNAFGINYTLHTNSGEKISKKMAYTADESYTWIDKITFDGIKIPYEKVQVQYYKKDNGDFIEPYLLNYDIYLEESDGKMIIKLPRLQVNEEYYGKSEDSKAIEAKNIKTEEITYEIYLDGKNGNDSNEGNSENPVKTLDKAKELAKKYNESKIIVIGTAELKGDADLSILNTYIIRGEKFNGYLFEVPSNETASITNITIDGNSENNKGIEKSLIYINRGATLNIGEGTLLRNNYIKDVENTATEGGAIKAVGATVNMTGGIIEKNQATRGGGIYLGSSTLNFTGGLIQNNEAKRVYDRPYNQYYSAGGGIIATLGSTINMSDQAKVLNNKAGEVGGGISVGSRVVESGDNTLNMSGGLVDGNIAGTSGGGIFVQTKYFSGGLGKAYITAGYITDNTMDGSGKTFKAFGGGGIYVNGATEEYGKNGELYIKNALIYNNESAFEGAGYAACPISKTIIHVNNGVAIYDNKASKGNELYILSSMGYGAHSGIPEYDISDRMLGGNLYNWKNEDGSLLKANEHRGRLEISGQELILHTDEQANEFAKKLAKVIISGNKSTTRGGGIGSNGTITFGSENETTEVPVNKVWDDNDNLNKTRPENIEVQLLAKLEGEEKDYLVESKTLNKDNEWNAVFENLPVENDGKKIIYTVKEKDVKGYTSTISGNQEKGFVITNTHTPEQIEIKGQKTWNDNNNQDGKRPDQITVKLFANGKEVARKEVKADETGDWSYGFENLDKYENGEEIIYTVSEEKVEGYVSQVNGYDITNTHTPEQIEIKGQKTWDDGNNQDGKRPDQITVKLFANGKEVSRKEVKADENGDWSYSFENLDK